MTPSLTPAKPRDREDHDEQGDRNNADADSTPHRRGQDGDAEVRRFGKPSRRARADRRLIIPGNGAGGRRQRNFDRLRFAGTEFGQLFGIEARFPALRRRRTEFYIACRFAAVVLCDDGQLAVLAGIGFAAETAAFTGECQAGLADDGNGDVEIGRGGLALGVQRELVFAGRRIARHRHSGFDVLRLAGLYRDAGELLGAIRLGKSDLEVLRRVGAEIDRGVAPAVVGDRDLELEGGRCGAAQGREVRGELELGRQLLPDRDSYRALQRTPVTAAFDNETIVTGAGTGRGFEPQLQLLLTIRRDDRRVDRLTAAEDCRLPSASHLRDRQPYFLRRQVGVAQRQVDRRGLAGTYG